MGKCERLASPAWLITCIYLITVGAYDLMAFVSCNARSWLYLIGIALMGATAHIERVARGK